MSVRRRKTFWAITALFHMRRWFAMPPPGGLHYGATIPQFCSFVLVPLKGHSMNSMKIIILLQFISLKKTPNDAVTLQRQSQFTPQMKANAISRLLSSLV